jgi:hypothetical protein
MRNPAPGMGLAEVAGMRTTTLWVTIFGSLAFGCSDDLGSGGGANAGAAGHAASAGSAGAAPSSGGAGGWAGSGGSAGGAGAAGISGGSGAAGASGASGASGSGGATGPGGPLLRVGMSGTFDDDIFGKGPVLTGGTWSDAGPIYGIALGRSEPKDLPAHIKAADEKDILLVLNMAGSRNQWTQLQGDCKLYDEAAYKARVAEYVGVEGLADAVERRRVIFYVVDEPNIDDFCGSITPAEANEMGLYHKQLWPGAITLIRSGAEVLTNGFSGEGPLGPEDWTGMDYAYGLYKGWMKEKLGKTPAEWYPEEKARLAKLDLGMVLGLNILNHGGHDCWDYQNDGSSSGRIRGQNQVLNGGVPCSQGMGNELNWLASPDFLRTVIDAVASDPDAPFLNMWTHIYSQSPDQEFLQYEKRADFVSAYTYMIEKGQQRTSWNGWRPAK